MDDFLQAAAGPPAADTAPGAAAAMAAEEAMPQRRPHEPAVRDFLRIKVLSMGDGHTGKSCLIKRYRNSEVEFVLPRDCFGKTISSPFRRLSLPNPAHSCHKADLWTTVVAVSRIWVVPLQDFKSTQHKMQHKMQCVEVSKSCH
jgi:hypothetical protein